MREIKFRVRDTKNNKWVDAVPSLEYLLDYGDHSISHHDIDEESGIYTYPKNITGDTFDGRLVWQQYTGLKDKNGKEIYEGDILFFQQQDGVWPNQLNKNIEVKYPLVCGNTHLGEIVGNIFENSELLNQ